MKTPKTKLSNIQMTVIKEIINKKFIDVVRNSDYSHLLIKPPDLWNENEIKFWELIDEITNQLSTEIETKLK